MPRRLALVLAVIAMQQAHAAPSPKAGSPLMRGVCYAHAWRRGGDAGYGSETSRRTLAHLRSDGVGWISLTAFGFMVSPGSLAIRFGDLFAGAETDERVRREAAQAHALGVKVALKPHLWVRGGAWQGALTWSSDEDFRRWFASYRAFVLHHAQLAKEVKADLLVIGTELKTATARDPAAWRALVADVRRTYAGPLTYAANWDEAESVTWWDALDYIGVDVYAPIASRHAPSLDDLRAGWRPLADALGKLSDKMKRPVILTELGYRATVDAALAPATWPEGDAGAKYDGDHQADCYRAAFESLWGRPWLAGVFLWKWFTDSSDESGPTDFSPAGKPAEAVLRSWFTRP